MIGPIMIPMPHSAIICGWPRRPVGIDHRCLAERRDEGPGRALQARGTSPSRSMFWAMPHSIEVSTKPGTEAMNRRREPIRSASQPVIGIATAMAMI